MEKAKENRRDIQFFSNKNGSICIVHSELAQQFAQCLESNPHVVGYSPCEPLLAEYMEKVNPLGIRSEYLDAMGNGHLWESDFLIQFSGGIQGVREIVNPDELMKRAVVEQLELSRRYWKAQGVTNWKIALQAQSSVEQEEMCYVF